MALQKNPVSINFGSGVDTKTDPYQVPVGKFLTLVNSVFTSAGRLTKRTGFNNLTALPNANQTTLTTLNDNLIATGTDLFAYSKATDQWLDQGLVQPVSLDTLSMVRSNTSQVSPDAIVTASGLACVVYMDTGLSYYQISDSITGQQIKERVLLPNAAINPRVFLLGVYFIITFISDVSGTPTLQYMAIPTADPTFTGVASNISASLNGFSAGYDAISIGSKLFFAWGSPANTLSIAFLTSSLLVSSVTTLAAAGTVTLVSLAVDASMSMLWVSYYDSVSTNTVATGFNLALGLIVAQTTVLTTTPIAELTSIANAGTASIFYQKINTYGYDANIRTDIVGIVTITSLGAVGTPTNILRSVGLASKAFMDMVTEKIYMLVVYGDTHQSTPTDNSNEPTYFLIDSTGAIYMRLAASNSGGYERSQVLPNVSLINGIYYIPYLITDFLTTVNKGTNLPSGTPVNAIYTQTGVNLAKFSFDSQQYSSEIAGALHLTGGQLWEYDGIKPVEHGFHVWPENVENTPSAVGGSIGAGTYFYQFTYEWTDNAGNIHRSAPSIPIKVTTTGATSSNVLHVPTLRLTDKIAPNPVRIVGYRYSAAQPVYYQFTSVTTPIVNSVTVDYVDITDTNLDASILGNAILYTTGGVIEDIAAPASIASALFQNRLWLIDAEDRNLLWFSKVVIQNVPVEMSDLLTIYVAPTTGAQGSTGPMSALSAMDDKLIIFKKDAIYYINGTGPDNTGANSSFSDPVFITGTVGCTNPNSIVLMPNGIMFQSDKGIWILGRGLDTQYIGAPVESFNGNTVMSAEAIPGTNQVRFILDNNVTLMYDYYFNQWGTHTNINAISATLYQGAHTYLNSYGSIFQESQSSYLDGSVPVLMSLTTSWINLAGIQGFERFYFANLLGTYFSPFKLNVSLAYNYNASATQSIIVTPDNAAPAWGGEALWGSGGPWGGSEGNVFTARIFPEKQKCSSFQVTIQELYDPSLGVSAGQGLSLSGLLLTAGMKRGSRTQSAAKSFG